MDTNIKTSPICWKYRRYIMNNKNLIKLTSFALFIIFNFISTISADVPEQVNYVIDDNLKAFKKWKESGGDIFKDIGGIPLINFAVTGRCNAKVLQYLIKHSVDLNQSSSLTNAPILNASRNKDISCLKLLIENGAQPDVLDSLGNNAYYQAVLYENTDAIEYLYNNGLSLFHKNSIGLDAIHMSALIGKSHHFKKVIERHVKDTK